MTPQQLKNSILQRAIEGRLVPQKAEEGSAQELIDKIEEEKIRLIEEGKLKKAKPLQPITEDEKPFDIPENWEWVRWGDLSYSIQYGYNAPAKDKGRIKMVRISDIQDNKVLWDTVPYCEIDDEDIETYTLQPNDILFARTGGTVGKSYLVTDVPEEAIYAGYLIRTRYSNLLVPMYLKFFMESSIYWEQLRNGTVATAQPNCNGKTLGNMILPLPPLAEQQRIVAKLEELLPLIDKYDKAYNKLTDFNTRFPEAMKKSLLQYAIQGKLVEQRSDEGTVQDLIQTIQAKKKQLIAEKKIKKGKTLPPITEDEIPFDIPEGWEWVRLGNLCSKIGSGNTPAGGRNSGVYKSEGVPLLREQNIYNDGINYKGIVYISQELSDTRQGSKVYAKDLLLNITGGSIGRCAIVPDDFTIGDINQHILIIRLIDTSLRKYVHSCICGPLGQNTINVKAVGARAGFSAEKCKNMLIPLPPLAEQHRIVAKLEELLPLCEQLIK